MFITKEFSKALGFIFLVAMGLFMLSVYLSVERIFGYSHSNDNTTTRIVLNQISNIVFTSAFWIAVAYLTKEKIGALVAYLIKMSVVGYGFYALLTNGFSPEHFEAMYWPNLLSMLSALLVFGLFYYKNSRALYLLLFYACIVGISSSPEPFYQLINRILGLIGLDDIMEIRIATGESSYRIINLFRLIVSGLRLPFWLIVFWYIIHTFPKTGAIDFSLKRVHVSATMSKGTFSIIYWVLRLVLFAAAFGAFARMEYALREGVQIQLLFSLLFFCVGAFIVGSLYRNFLVSFFVSKGRYPGWLYWFLNIPIIHFIAWLIALLIPTPKETKAISEATVIRQTIQQRTEVLKARFQTYGNPALKFMIVFALFCISVYQLNRMGFRIDGPSREGANGAALMSICSLALTIWYMMDKKALFVLFGLQVASVFLLVLTGSGALLSAGIAAGMINVFIYYGLFHFDQLTFEGDPDEADEASETIDYSSS